MLQQQNLGKVWYCKKLTNTLTNTIMGTITLYWCALHCKKLPSTVIGMYYYVLKTVYFYVELFFKIRISTNNQMNGVRLRKQKDLFTK